MVHKSNTSICRTIRSMGHRERSSLLLPFRVSGFASWVPVFAFASSSLSRHTPCCKKRAKSRENIDVFKRNKKRLINLKVRPLPHLSNRSCQTTRTLRRKSHGWSSKNTRSYEFSRQRCCITTFEKHRTTDVAQVFSHFHVFLVCRC